jgi:hypothetical protein
MAALIVLAPLLGAGACASAPSKPVNQPALIIPLPPPHVVPITPEPVVEPVGEIPGAGGTPSGTPANRTGRGSRETTPRPASNEARPEPKPGEAKPPDTPPATETPVPVPPPGPTPQLRTAESSGTEGTVRATIDSARQLLATVDYRRLTQVRRKAYDDAKKFADQADEALKQGNVVFAQGVAGKAETLAKELARR